MAQPQLSMNKQLNTHGTTTAVNEQTAEHMAQPQLSINKQLNTHGTATAVNEQTAEHKQRDFADCDINIKS
jgi:hypothetical protein